MAYPVQSSYLPVPVEPRDYPSREDTDIDNNKQPLLPDEDSDATRSNDSTTWMNWATFVVSAFTVLSAFMLYSTSNKRLAQRWDTQGLRHPDMYPGIELADRLSAKGPLMYFPNAMIRANRASPDQVFTPSSHVLLTDQDSMFYQYSIRESPFTECFIEAEVPPLNEMLAANKSYSAVGDVSAIEVWNVTYPGRLTSLSWNTRPRRIALLGTLNFTSDQREDGWQLHDPTPQFPCSKGIYTVEITCSACRLEFLQIFSSPPLAFDLQQLG